MYCNNCGKRNPTDSNFCKYCGSEMIKVSTEKNEVSAQNKDDTKSSKKDYAGKTKPGLSGWLALVGLGLIIGLLLQGYGVLEYVPLLADTYNIPGYLTLLQIEFFVSTIFTLVTAYLLYLYFKKNINFPKYYVSFLIASIVYVILDHLFLASLSAPTQELQQIINDALSENSGSVARTIIISIIWILYMKRSKQVKVTFIND